MQNRQEVWIISGVPAGGKTNTSKALARSFDRAAVISRDELQAQIISTGNGHAASGYTEQDKTGSIAYFL
ncbi:MAG: hypothetical protein NZ820_06955 [Dehalococcoidia bacterium]|nr:hypothetical protein [Dehalococcoidia bacterium]